MLDSGFSKFPSKSAAILVADPMTLWENYYVAHSLAEALNILQTAPEAARIIAGGTDLLLDIQQGRLAHTQTLVDITGIGELNELEIRGNDLFIGAAVPLNKIIYSEIVQEHAQAIVEACSLIGGPQVRNIATLGGNVAHALPAGDGTIALIAHNADAEVVDLNGRKRIALEELFIGPGISKLEANKELLMGFYLPLRDSGCASVFRRVMRPQGVAIAILNIAIWLRRKDNQIFDIRIAIGPSGPVPKRALSTEAVLRGSRYHEKALKKAANALLNESKFRTSRHRATKEYRQKIAVNLLEDTLDNVWKQTQNL
ncbi:MAG: FAD binding domain-containing protein [Anaerolineales bacterium]|jgi:carbon-monoxide dehydrogenase medium subunit